MTPLADLARSLAERPRPVTLYGAPEGYEAAAIGDIVAEGHVLPWLHVCRDDGRMARFVAALEFFHPELDALTFPAWDCLPYDRVSPNGEIVSRRIDTLTRLATGGGDMPLVVLTTVNALIQRVPPKSLFDGRVLTPRPGGRIGLDRLQSFFQNNGYIRTDTVREPGEFAVRGGIVDLYPAGAVEPLRMDFFGDVLESIRSFDPLTQRSTGTLDQAALRPVSEVLLDDAAADGEFARFAHRVGAGVPIVAEEALQPVEPDPPARAQAQHPTVEDAARGYALDHRVDRGQHDERRVTAAGRQPGQGVDTPADDLAVRRNPVVRQAVPRRESQCIELGVEEGECCGKARHPAVVAADMEPGEDVTFCDDVADCRGLVPFRRPVQGHRARPLGQRACELGERRHGGLPKERRRRVTSWSCSGGGRVRPVIQSKRSASAHSSNAS